MSVTIYPGDNRQWLSYLKESNFKFSAVVTDPPYGLVSIKKRFSASNAAPAKHGTDGAFARASRGFMGKEWDGTGIENDPAFWRAVFDVMLPGAYCFAFSGTRTVHRQMVAMEDAGFILHPLHIWAFGSGFPKAHAADKAIDKLDATHARRERQSRFTEWVRSTGLTSAQIDRITGTNMGGHYTTAASQPAVATRDHFEALRPYITSDVPQWVEEMVDQRTVESENFKRREVIGERTVGIGTGKGNTSYISDSENRDITAPATPEAARWAGWAYGTQAQKPALEPIVLAQKPFSEKTGAANILRHGVGAVNIDACRVPGESTRRVNSADCSYMSGTIGSEQKRGDKYETGSEKGRHPANLIHDGSPEVVACFPQTGKSTGGGRSTGRNFGQEHDETASIKDRPRTGHDDNGGSAARFFHAFPADEQGVYYHPKASKADRAGSKHPTVKPIALMQHLIRHITPPGGTVLDPFAGSGATGEAARREGFDCALMEREPEYLEFLYERFKP